MPSKVRWGVIGSGGIARRRTIPEGIAKANNAVLSAVFDKDPKANAEVAEQFNATPVTRLDELLAKDIDAVYIATPAHLHYEHVEACARAGKTRPVREAPGHDRRPGPRDDRKCATAAASSSAVPS